MSDICNSAASLTILDAAMDTGTVNGPLPPERAGDEELPLIPLSPVLDRSERLKALSKLSLQSLASVFDDHDVTDAGDDDVQGGNGNGEKPGNLHKASLSGDEAEVKNILSKEPDLNLLDKSGRTPLHLAILGRHVKIIEMLLEAGADTSLLDESQDAPLHMAVRTGDENLVGIFLRRDDSDANIKGHGSRTALHIAADLDKVSICKILIEHGASPDCRDDNNMTPLTQAVEKGSKNAVEFFFDDAKSRETVMKDILCNVDSEGSTLLHLAVNSGNTDIVQLCLDNGAVIRQPKESDRRTPFHEACAQGSLEIIQLFASNPTICRINVIAFDSEGLTPLHVAALNNHSDVVKYLLEQGASIDPRDKLRRTPLFLAAGVGGTESVRVLIDGGADVKVKDVDLRSCVRVAVGHTATMEVLLRKREAFRLITAKDITGFAPVHYAAKYGHLQIMLLFMERNRSTTTVTSDELHTALHGAARYGWREIVEVLLSGRNIRSINLKDNQGKTALHFACVEGHDPVVERLLKLGATVEKDHNNRTALHIAAKRGSKRCVECILQHHPKCINLLDKNQNTALHVAGIQDCPEVVSHLLSYPEQEILMNNKNHNVLDAAFNAEKKSVLLAIASHERWREVLTSSNPGHIAQMQKFVIKMPEVARRFMDQCITKDGNPDGEDYKITYDFTIIQGAPKPDQDRLMVLKSMLKYRRIDCLTHPVCFTVMNKKWQTFGWKALVLNLILYLLFVIPLTILAIYSRANEKHLCGVNETMPRKEYIDFDVPCTLNHPGIQCAQVIVGLIALFHLIKELLQLKKQRMRYLTSFTNYLELVGYCFALFYIIPPCDCKLGFKQEVGALTLFFAWVNLVLFLRRSCYCFFMFVMAFSSTFYLLLDEETEPYSTFPYSMMTIFVMTLGELNYADIFMPWDKLEYATLTNILFVMFVLGMPIILMNMLVGLAVGDIDKIQESALIDRYVMQVELVLDMEETVPKSLVQRAHVDKHVEYPNNNSSKLYEQLFSFSRPGEDEEEEDDTPPDLPLLFSH
ncbi:Transient receptor putative cation channel sub A member 1 [Desmophyllum pertusum]|uniref:Transient receptor putative cation channel sub A member 1 n=1 Tax=Desmophyllum pertusum TaxID=174260 RepID=A0A9W9Z0W1_9CNID|nr:Transient receptor putative cation channel sub A member 1 [Desmophyllum pertusum]